MFLSKETLKELTGRKNKSAQIRWLREKGYPFEVDADGFPKVLSSTLEARMGGKVAKEPQLRLA